MIAAGFLICLRSAANPGPPTPVDDPDVDPDTPKEAEEPARPNPWEDDYWENYYNQYGSFLPIFFALLTAAVGTARMMGIKYYT